MKCSKKKAFLGLLPVAVAVSTLVVCAILFFPKFESSILSDSSTLTWCDGKECSDIQQSLAAAVSRKSCDSEECVLAAAKVIQLMDRTSDPCEDFFNFSCGSFHHFHTLPQGRNVFNSFDVYEEELDLDIKSILEDPNYGNDSESLLKTKEVYKSCMDLEYNGESSVRHLRDVLSSTGIGEWPFLNPDWKECRLDLEWRMAKLNAVGMTSLVELDTAFIKRAEYRLLPVMNIAKPLIFVGDCDEENSNESLTLEMVVEHMEVLQAVLELLDVNITDDVKKDIEDIFIFDYNFCNATQKCREDDGSSAIFIDKRKRSTLLTLADAAPQINWIRWRNIVFSELRLNFPHDKQDIYVYNLKDCIGDLDNLLRRTPAKVLSNYLTWKFVLTHLGYLGTPFRQILENHPMIPDDVSERFDIVPKTSVPRWKQCVTYIKHHMDMSVLKEYNDRLQQKGIQEEAMDKIASLIKNEFRIIMKDTRSLLENDRIKTLHKIDRIQALLAYPPKDDHFYATFYSSIIPLNDSFLKNGMALRSIRMRKLMEGVSTSKSLQDMEYAAQKGSNPLKVTALMSDDSDFVIISLPMLKSLGLTDTMPKCTCRYNNFNCESRAYSNGIPYKSMASMGVFLGHELNHAFDLRALDSSFQFNWTTFPPYVLRQAQRKAKCFMKVPGNGSTLAMLKTQPTIIEDLSDHEGIHLAFKAYLRYLNEEGDEEILPGLPFSNVELFFINFAQQFCEIRSTEENFGTHSPGRQRVNNVLRNYPAFSETFRCSVGKRMNAHKCDILWQ